ncbi:MAG: M13 family metallopeptidase [Saccharofermentans sp.]|nr:M13 family metallopeptidase [Saccharofermentans sp.]
MHRNKGIALTCALSLAAGIVGGCTVQMPEETGTYETAAELPPARAQDDYYRFINEETIVNAGFEYGEQSTGEAFDSDLIQDQVEGIISDCVNGSGYSVGTEEYVIQNAYNCFMAYDFESGEVPEQLDQILHEIDGISSIEEYLEMDAGLMRDYGVPGIFNFDIDTNYLGVDEYILGFDVIRGVGDVQFKDLEDSYAPLDTLKTFGSAVMQATGHDQEEADAAGTQYGYLVMDIYNATDPDILNEIMPFMYIQELSADEIEQVLSNVDFTAYLEEYGITGIDKVAVTDLGQLEAINNMLTEDNLDALKVWLMCRFAQKYQRFIAHGYPELAAYADIDYASREEQAMHEIRYEFTGCTDVLYVEQYWSDEQDEALRSMCDDIREGYRDIITNATWLSEETRQGCLDKLDNMVYVTASNTGRHDPSYYAGLTYDNYLNLYIQMQQLAIQEKISHLYEEYDRTSTWMYMQEFNACYNPSFNNITITVAITNSPFFDVDADYYTNLGGLGMVIGHEMGHAFDSNCILFNSQGAYDPDWIPEEDYQTLLDRNQAAVSYFEDYFTIFGVYHVDGEQTLGENYADLGSMECITSLAHNEDELRLLFENYARIWCAKTVDEALIDQLATDEHSPAMIRVNAILATLDPFYEVYDVQPGDGMYIAPENRISRWY